MALAPRSPVVLQSAGFFFFSGFRDYVRAQVYFEQSLRVRPNSPGTLRAIAGMRRQQGQWSDAITQYRKAIELDPGNASLSGVFGFVLERMRHFELALTERRRRAGMVPDNLEIAFGPAQVAFRATGSTAEATELFARLSKSQAESRVGLQLRKQWAYRTGNLVEFLQLDRATSREQLDDIEGMVAARTAAIVLAATGDMAGARARLSPAVMERNRERVRAEPLNDGAWRSRAEAEALLGNKDEALRCAREAVRLAPETIDAMDGALVSRSLAFVYSWTGDKESALAEYARLLRLPGAELFVHEMRRSPEFFPLQGDSRFQALLDDPKSNSPLF
jgi:tetratricopeptide (TPR) repeat protein